MSADALRIRATEDIQEQVDVLVARLTEGREMELDQMRYHQGMVAGLREAARLLEDRARNLFAIG